MKKLLSLILTCVLCVSITLSFTSCGEQAAKPEIKRFTSDYDYYNQDAESGYIFVRDQLREKLADESLTLKPLDYSENADIFAEREAIFLDKNSTLSFEINSAAEAAYHLNLDYFIPESSLQNLQLKIKINGEYQYDELNAVELPAVWTDIAEEPRYDMYLNQIYPTPERVFRWQNKTLNHSIYCLDEPFIFLLNEGVNTITIENNDVAVYLGDITLEGERQLVSYDEYSAEIAMQAGSDNIIIEGEKYSEKSQSYIRPSRSKNCDYEPHDSSKNLINTLDGNMWADPSSAVSYNFSVENSGVYYVTMKYLQDIKSDMPVFKNIYIDGRLLFEEFKDYCFDYTTGIVNHTLSDGEKALGIYLEAGEHTITLESTASLYYEIYEVLLKIISRMNDIGLDVRMVTGGKTDKNRQWQIEDYLPDLSEQLEGIAKDIDACYDILSSISGRDNVSVIVNLKIASANIRKGLEDLDDFVNAIDSFSQGSGSVAESLANLLPDLLKQPMIIDRIYINSTPESIENAGKGFIEKLGSEIQILFSSYFATNEDYQQKDKETLEIWANMSVNHVEILRQMIDTYYDGDYDVDVSVMTDESKLLLSVAGESSPDAAIGVSLARPFDFALRNAAYDLRNFDDFGAIMGDFTDEMFVPFTLNDGCYAIPQNVTFYVLFYRTDIIEKLGLEIPQTWDDIIAMLPTLNRYGMSFNTTLCAGDAYKPFAATVPFIQQFDGNLYAEDGAAVAFGESRTVESFTFMTDLFTRYSVPISIPNFYFNFKNSISPIGVSEINTYNLLTNAAPEIYGKWDIAPSIGVKDENGSINNCQPSVTSGCLIMENSEKKEAAWDFLKWWMSAETQLTYSNLLRLTYGPEYLWSTANLTALEQYSVFSERHRQVILEQLINTRETPRTPAYYQIERDLSNAWNNVVLGEYTAREALDKAIITSNRAIEKKLAEFGMSGENFTVATAERISQWRKDYEKQQLTS